MDCAGKYFLAVVLAADDAFAFALGAALLSFKTNSPRLFKRANFIVYTRDMSPRNRRALGKICDINFKDFAPPFDAAKIPSLKKYTELTLARYECFYMLGEYQNVLWLDIDILVLKELQNILNYGAAGIALANDLNLFAFNFIKKPPVEADLTKPNFNAGVMLLSDKLADYKKIGDWCYQETRNLADYLRWPDQAIINLALQHFNLQPDILPAGYNAHPFSAPVPMKDALLAHSMGANKFWSNCQLAEWFLFYRQWEAFGGAPMPPAKTNILFAAIFKTKLFIEKIPFLWAIFNIVNKYKFKRLNQKILRSLLWN